jgi:hypothetical protein
MLRTKITAIVLAVTTALGGLVLGTGTAGAEVARPGITAEHAVTTPAPAAGADGIDDADDVQPQIIGGHAPTQPYPGGAMVSLKYDAPDYGREAWHTCGATLVDGNHLRTAAHCVTDMPEGLAEAQKSALAAHFKLDLTSVAIPTEDKQFWVRVGSPNKDSGGIVARVLAKGIHVDPRWNWGMTPGADMFDVAVLDVDRFVDAYELPIAPRKARPGDEVFQLGWGTNQADGNGPAPTMIRELKTTVVSNNKCAAVGITAREVCVNNADGARGDCYGDSGGPLVIAIDGVLYDVGIVSRGGEFCGTTPSVYTSTPEYLRWIYDTMRGVPAPAPKSTGPGMTRPTVSPKQAEFALAG